MGGCSVLGNPCGNPGEDPQSPEETANCDLVAKFIQQVWNHQWTPAENTRFLEEKELGNREYVPDDVAAALARFCSAATVRHRQDGMGNPIRSSGPGDYENCINLVHEVTPDLRIDLIQVIGHGDRVVAQIRVSGSNQRLDGKQDQKGAFERPADGRRFSLQTATLYRMEQGRIAEDWLLYGFQPTIE